MSLYGPIVMAGATGGAGAAAATAVSANPLRGFVAGIYVQYNDAPPATTDVGIKTKSNTEVTLPNIPILTISNANTSGYFIPQVATVTASNVATGQYGLFYIEDYVQIDIAQANDGDSVTTWLYMVD